MVLLFSFYPQTTCKSMYLRLELKITVIKNVVLITNKKCNLRNYVFTSLL